jgi:DNA-binding MarR family transcriptional regulator
LNCIDHSLARWVSILYRYGQSYVTKRIESYNLGSGQFVALITLFGNDGISQDQMSKYLKIDKASIAKAVRPLEKEGYIRREVDENDKRAYKVYLTQKAFDIREELFEVINEWENTLLSDLSDSDKELFLKFLKKVALNASNTATILNEEINL